MSWQQREISIFNVNRLRCATYLQEGVDVLLEMGVDLRQFIDLRLKPGMRGGVLLLDGLDVLLALQQFQVELLRGCCKLRLGFDKMLLKCAALFLEDLDLLEKARDLRTVFGVLLFKNINALLFGSIFAKLFLQLCYHFVG